MHFFQREVRENIIHSINNSLKVRSKNQIQLITIKGIHRLNQIYGYETCDRITDRFYLTMKQVLTTVSPLAEVFRATSSTFITVSPAYSQQTLLKQGESIYAETDKVLNGLVDYPDVVRCSIVTIPISRNVKHIDEILLAKIEYYVNFYSKEQADIYAYDESFCNKMLRQSDIKVRLSDALLKEKIIFYFQPKYNNENVIVGFESLARWQDEQLGWVTPDEFIPEFEHSPLYAEFCHYAVIKSIRALKTLHLNGYSNMPVSINVMKQMFEDDSFANFVADIADDNDIDYSLITLEITETALPELAPKIAQNIGKLRSLGIKIAIDDFGVGDSSFSRLMKLDFDELKLDREFISLIDTENKNCNPNKIIASICQTFKSLGVTVVIEGIETKTQRDFVFDNFDIDVIQGFYYSKPLPIEELIGKG